MNEVSGSWILLSSFPEVVWKCFMSPEELTAIKTFLVTPGAQRGRHLNWDEGVGHLPDVSGWHLFLKIIIEDVTWLLREDVEDFDAAILHSGGDVLVIVVITHTEGRLFGVTKGVFVRNLGPAARASLSAFTFSTLRELTRRFQRLESGRRREGP